MDNQNLSSNQLLDFSHISRDFELREKLEKSQSSKQTFNNNLTNSIGAEDVINMERSLPIMNDNIRANIRLGIEIYKQLKNFDRNYIHEVINEKSKNSK